MAATTIGNRAGKAAIITAAETNILSAAGGSILRRVIVNNVGNSATLDIYDHASTAQNKVFEWVTADGKMVREVDIPLKNGLTVISGGTLGNVVVVWE